jgi:hydroxyethylthiazole kinase
MAPAAVTPDRNQLATAAAEVLARVRAQRPLVHVMAGGVSLNDMANAIQCLGGAPVMAVSPAEAAEMASGADALVLNLGMPTADRLEAMLLAGAGALSARVPIVLDPVGVAATAFRAEAVALLLARLGMAVIRGNAAEIAWLAGGATHQRAVAVSRRTGAVVAATGARDAVSDGRRAVSVANGTPLLGAVVGSGCMGGALVGCCAAVEADHLLATVAALVAIGVAGERAVRLSNGPGTYKACLLDCLGGLDPDDLAAEARIEALPIGADVAGGRSAPGDGASRAPGRVG